MGAPHGVPGENQRLRFCPGEPSRGPAPPYTYTLTKPRPPSWGPEPGVLLGGVAGDLETCATPRRGVAVAEPRPLLKGGKRGQGQVITGAEGGGSPRLPEPLPALALKRIYTASAHRSPQRMNRNLHASVRSLPAARAPRPAPRPPSSHRPPMPRLPPAAYLYRPRPDPAPDTQAPPPRPLSPFRSPGNRAPPSHWSIPT